MSGDARSKSISNLNGRFGELPTSTGSSVASSESIVASIGDEAFPTMAPSRFFEALQGREAPVILDLGRAIGSNVTFLGEQLGCKVFIEDLFSNLDRIVKQKPSGKDMEEALQAAVASRITQETDTVDGVLGWDIIEHLTPPIGRTLAAALVRVLRPGVGLLMVSFGTKRCYIPGHRRYEIIGRSEMKFRFERGASLQLRVLQSREVIQMFRELNVVDSFLLKTHTREMIFRKPTCPSC